MTPEERAEQCVILHSDKSKNDSILMPADILERIEQAICEAVEAEREACAKIADKALNLHGWHECHKTAASIARDIRARTNGD
jgi:hypothetical protein